VRLLSRNGNDWVARYPLITAAVASAGAAMNMRCADPLARLSVRSAPCLNVGHG
jgi:hypothetical protein